MMNCNLKHDMTADEFIEELGIVFDSFLSQDSGNKCYSLRTPQGSKWIKILNLAQTPIDSVQETLQFYNSLSSELIPRNWNLVELSDCLVMIHDWVPGRVLNSPDENRRDANSTYQRFMRLPVERRLTVFDHILQLFIEIEGKNIIIEDFYDGCVIYDFDRDEAHICDLDHIHFGEYVLNKDRQYGSSRFMAPEEFTKGSSIDHRTNVFTMGSTGYVLLNDNRREIQDWGLPRSLYYILKKAVSHEKEDRYSSLQDFYQVWQSETKG